MGEIKDGFSTEWENIYKNNQQFSVWPFTKLITLVKRYTNLKPCDRVLELGCGAGANIPFFVSLGVDYYAVEGSQTTVDLLKKKYSDNQKVHIAQGDFTKSLVWDGNFSLIVDRSSLTHNETKDIENTILMIKENLKDGGFFIGVDWHSDKKSSVQVKDFIQVDEHTKIFNDGYYKGIGKVHISDEGHIRELFKDFNIIELDENVDSIKLPEISVSATWSFVVKNEHL